MRVAALDDGRRAVPLQKAHLRQRRVEVEVGAAARFFLPRHAVQDGDVEQVGQQRGHAVAAFAARAPAVAQHLPGTGHLVEVELLQAARAQVHAHHAAHAALRAHHVGGEVVEGAAVGIQLAVDHHGRQGARDGDARTQRARQIALVPGRLATARVVAGDAEVRLPEIDDVHRRAREGVDGTLDDAAHALALDERDHGQQVVVARGVDLEGLAQHAQGVFHGLVHGDGRGHHRAHAGAAHAVDLHAALHQRLPHAQVREAARATAGQHQAHGLAAEQPRQPRHVGGQRGAHVQVAGDGAAVDPVAHAARRARVGRVHEDQGLGRFVAPRAIEQAGALHRVQRGRLRRIGQQQDLVALFQAQARPVAGLGIGHQQHEVVFALQRLQRHRLLPARQHLAATVAAIAFAIARARNHAGRVDAAGAPVRRERLHQPLCEGRGVHAIADGQQRHRHRRRQGARLVLRLQPFDDLARERDGHLRVAGHERAELLLVQPRHHARADGHHGGRARRVGVEAHLAGELAATEFAHRARALALALHVHAQAAADREVGRITRLALGHQHLAAFQALPLHAVEHVAQRAFFDARKILDEVGGQGVAPQPPLQLVCGHVVLGSSVSLARTVSTAAVAAPSVPREWPGSMGGFATHYKRRSAQAKTQPGYETVGTARERAI